MIEPGVVISDRYRVIRLLGEGGMGSVFEAEHTGVGRKVAVKVLRSEYARKRDIVGRFEREARSAAAIGHDNIIDVLDFGMHEGAPYMVMEYLRGESLSARLERTGRMSIESASYIMAQILSALGAAHAAGIVHRDLKPDNVYLIPKAGMSDFVKLLDFGIAKLKGDDGEGGEKAKHSLTQTGMVMGTPYYMSPEQALAKRDIDHRADLYSAGVMLYEMVTGQVPFDAESQTELLLEIVYQPHGVKRPRERQPLIPEEYDAIVMKAMAKERDERYQEAGEFSAAVAQFAGAPPPAGVEVTGRFRPPGNATPAETVTPVKWEKSPSVTQSDGTPAATVTAAPTTKTRSPWRGVLIAGAIAAVMAVGGTVWMRSNDVHGLVRSEMAQVAPPPPATPLPPAQVSIDLEQLPADAVIVVDGQPGPSPHLQFVRGSTHTIRVSAPGKQPFSTSVSADRDRSIEISLTDLPPAPAVPTPEATPQTPVPAPPSTAPARDHVVRRTQHGSGGAQRTNANPLLPVSSEF